MITMTLMIHNYDNQSSKEVICLNLLDTIHTHIYIFQVYAASICRCRVEISEPARRCLNACELVYCPKARGHGTRTALTKAAVGA